MKSDKSRRKRMGPEKRELNRIPLRLPEKEFLKTFKKAPRVAVNLLISNIYGEILLTRRNISPFEGYWHFPGSFLLLNETIDECRKRVAENELNLKLNEGLKGITFSLLGAFDDLRGDPRGHVVDLIFGTTLPDISQIKATTETSEVKFFKELPKKMGFNHKDTLHKLGYEDEE